MDYNTLTKKYPNFIYHSYNVTTKEDVCCIEFKYEIEGLDTFTTKWQIPFNRDFYIQDIDENILSRLAYNLGLVESISYWKMTCSPNYIIKCGNLSKFEEEWWRKLFYKGLGEFQFLNNIEFDYDTFINFDCDILDEKKPLIDTLQNYSGVLVPVGGGKDSVVSLELLRCEYVSTYAINANSTTKNVIDRFFDSEEPIICEKPLPLGDSAKLPKYNPDFEKRKINAKRILDAKILKYNNEGFLNGHIPFSSVVAFSAFISAYLNGNKYIALSNESSASEPTVKGSFVNHQYSKSFEFEKDFNDYIKAQVTSDIHYFSLLRPLSEAGIAKIFSNQFKYFDVFRSCNRGSKKGVWCNECSKCLFVYIILSPHIPKHILEDVIFGESLLDKDVMEQYFLELTGLSEHKPFECVGTIGEIRASLKYIVEKGFASKITDKYKDTILSWDEDLDSYINMFNEENLLTDKLENLVKDALYE